MKKYLTPLFVLALAACSHAGGGSAPTVAAIGSPAPPFDEATAAGGMLSMASLAGKPVYLNFFASWCPPCNEEAPSVNAVAQEFKSRGLAVVGVDVLEDRQKAQQFITEHHLSYPAVIDSGALRDAYEINGMPVHVFIDRTGIVRKIVVGELTKAKMEADVRAIL